MDPVTKFWLLEGLLLLGSAVLVAIGMHDWGRRHHR